MTKLAHEVAARTLVAAHDRATLGTTERNDGRPYTSLVEYAPMPNGDPLLFVSSLAEHTKNIDRSTEASLLVAADPGRPRPLARRRVTLLGEVVECEKPRERLAERYLDVHPHADQYIDFEDFRFVRLVPDRLRYIAGFGEMSWVDGETYRAADPDPVRLRSEPICEHMNDDHADALVDIARELGDAEWAELGSLEDIDRYGFELEARSVDGDRRESLRISFEEPLDSAHDARGAFVELLERARSRRNGAGE